MVDYAAKKDMIELLKSSTESSGLDLLYEFRLGGIGLGSSKNELIGEFGEPNKVRTVSLKNKNYTRFSYISENGFITFDETDDIFIKNEFLLDGNGKIVSILSAEIGRETNVGVKIGDTLEELLTAYLNYELWDDNGWAS